MRTGRRLPVTFLYVNDLRWSTGIETPPRAQRDERCRCRSFLRPYLVSFGMCGLHGTLAVDSGVTSTHGRIGTRRRVVQDDGYPLAKREAVAGAQQKRALAVLTGGRLAS